MSTGKGDVHTLLETLLQDIPKIRPNARSVRAAGQNALCARRTVLEAGGRANLRELAKACGAPTDPDPSLFAIARGDRHEEQVMGSDGHLLALLRDEVGLPLIECSVRDLRAITKGAGLNNLRRRHAETKRWLRRVLEGHPDAENVVRGAILRIEVAGFEMFIEPDAVIAVFVDGVIYIVEIKSYAAWDGVVPSDKAAHAAAQSAVYMFAIRSEVEALGYPPEVVSDTALLITATNATLYPSIHRMNLGPDVRRVARDLERMASVENVLRDLMTADPEGLASTFDAAGLGDSSDERTKAAWLHNRDVLSRVPKRFVPACLTNCPMGNVCRDEARASGHIESYGLDHARVAGAILTTRRMVEILHGAKPTKEEDPAARSVRLASQLLTEAGYALPKQGRGNGKVA